MKYITQLISKEVIAENTMAFHFKKPEGFTFRAGQFLDWTLVNSLETDAEGNMRAFSIIATPQDGYIGIATRMRDTAFKRNLKNAQPGLEVEIDGPIGSFVLHQKATRAAIMLVGGIGITPFFSIIKDATERKLPHKMYLFYSNRRPEDTVFLRALKKLEEINPNFKLILTMTDLEKSREKWEGETGYINQEMIAKYVSEDERGNAIYYTAGPQAMVGAMRKLLTDSGISEDDIKTEEFSGY
jgi:ferredoxin-NADP reductase